MENKLHCPISFYIHFKKIFAHRPEAIREIFETVKEAPIIKSLSVPFHEIDSNGNLIWNNIIVKPVKSRS